MARIPGADQATVTRASLYRAASRIGIDRAGGAIDTLRKIDAARLPPEEKDILRTALRVAAEIVDAPMGGAQTPAPGATAEPADLDPRMKRLLSGAERSLAEAQKLLADPVFTPARSGDARP